MSSSASPSRCLILGGGGFLGGHLLEALLEQDRRVRVFDRIPRPAAGPSALPEVQWCEGDFGNRGDVASAVDGCDVVFHLVATTMPKASNEDPVHDLESNLLPTIRFLEAAVQHGVKRVIFASSGGTVYGVPASVPIHESHPLQPICSYGIHKLAIEQYLHLYRTLHGLEYCVLRLANPFGERQRRDASQGAVAVFLDRALRGEDVTVWGDGSAVRDYIYVRDVAAAFCRAASARLTQGTFNIGSGRGLSVNELLDAIEALLGRPVGRQYVAGRTFDVPINVLDIRRAADTLGWQPRFSFRDGLERTLDWMQAVRGPSVTAS
jgi:UDP-glucose 4-epimerase